MLCIGALRPKCEQTEDIMECVLIPFKFAPDYNSNDNDNGKRMYRVPSDTGYWRRNFSRDLVVTNT